MWTYEQRSGYLKNGALIVGVAYSGSGLGKNNPEMQAVHNVGPLPVGFYTLDTPHDNPTLGPFAIHLTPADTNEMYGRFAFYMHGDSHTHPGAASHGCIVCSIDVRRKLDASKDRELEVVHG